MCCWGEKGLNSLVVARFSGRGEEGVVAFPHPQELLLLLGEHLGLVLPGMDAQRMVSTAEPDRVFRLARAGLTRRSRQSSRRRQTLLWTGRDRPGLQLKRTRQSVNDQAEQSESGRVELTGKDVALHEGELVAADAKAEGCESRDVGQESCPYPVVPTPR
jgi:hypothetical protein